jgi:hypothetical protein
MVFYPVIPDSGGFCVGDFQQACLRPPSALSFVRQRTLVDPVDSFVVLRSVLGCGGRNTLKIGCKLAEMPFPVYRPFWELCIVACVYLVRIQRFKCFNVYKFASRLVCGSRPPRKRTHVPPRRNPHAHVVHVVSQPVILSF